MKTVIITEDRNLSAELSGLVLLVEVSGRVSIQNGDLSGTDLDARDIALLGGRIDLVAARNWCALLRAAFPLPVLMVAEQSVLVAIDERWCVDDVVMPELPSGGQSQQWLRRLHGAIVREAQLNTAKPLASSTIRSFRGPLPGNAVTPSGFTVGANV